LVNNLATDNNTNKITCALGVGPPMLSGRAETLQSLGQYQEAVIWYNKTLEIDPDSVYDLAGKENALDSLGRYEDAIIWFDKALEIEPNNELILNDKGFAITNLERYQEAITLYDKALEIELGYVTALNKATTFWSLGQYQDAITV
jgi:tetratricopeptide (TPR) repeat protein